MDKLEEDIKQLIVSVLNLEDIDPSEIDSEEALFVEGLGLDSIDALELGVAIQKKYAVKISAKDESIRHHFRSVKNLANFIHKERGETV